MTRRYRREWLVLALIGAAALTVLNPRNPQDVTRIGLSLSILERGSLNIDPYALGTIAGPLGSTTFDNGVAAAVAFAAFYVAAKGRRLAAAAGAVAGAAVLFEYQTALIAIALAGYVAVRYGRRPLLAFVAGGL